MYNHCHRSTNNIGRNKTTKCPATVKQTGPNYVRGPHKHIHASEPGAATCAKITAKIKSRASRNLFAPAGAIVDEVLLDELDPDAPCHELPKPVNLARAANRKRQKMRPTDPIDINFDLDTSFLPDGFLRQDIRRQTVRHIIFATDNQLQLLTKAKSWYIDGTFQVVKAPFHQLMSVHAFVRSNDKTKQVPLAFVLMSRRQTEDYKSVLRSLISCLDGEPCVQQVILDYEKAAWKAIKIVLPDITIQGCVFHWSQAVWRKAQELGLQSLYMKNDATMKFIRRILALPFLPASKIPTMFTALRRHASTQPLKDLCSYIDETWITSRTWPVSSRSIYQRPVRTNNDVEGWHRRLNLKARKGQLPMYLLMQLLHEEAKMVALQVRLVREEKLQRLQRKQYRNMHGKIQKNWEDYAAGTKSPKQLLKDCAFVYMLHISNELLTDYVNCAFD